MRSSPSRGLVAVAVAALVFLAGVVGWTVGRDDDVPGAGSADVGFLHDMILHHEQAVRMAATAVATPDAHRSVEHFAREVLIFQQYEIGLMEAYLQRWGYPRQSGSPTVMRWMGHEMPAEEMPGLASDAELDAYEKATGRAVDEGFLRLMRAHHRGGVDMAAQAEKLVRDPLVRDLARRMARNQRSEIVEYERLAARLGISLVT